MNRPNAEDAERREGGVYNSNEFVIDVLLSEALAFYNTGNLVKAAEKYQEILHINGDCAEAWDGLGMVYFNQEKYQDALEFISQALSIDTVNPNLHYSLGLVLEKIGYLEEAIATFQKVIELAPNWIEAYHSLGKLLAETGDFVQSETIYLQAIELDKNDYRSYLYLGNLLMMQQQIEEAIIAYQTSLQIKSSDSVILHNLAIAYAAKNESTQASLYFGYAAYYQGDYQQAITNFQNFLNTQTGKVDLYLQLCLALQECGQTQEAIKIINDSLNLFPNNLTLKLENVRILPILYKNQPEIEFYRQRFTQGLSKLTQAIDLVTTESKENALQTISWRTNFYLQYQGYNDLELQKIYGNFVHQVMSANYPQWAEKQQITPLKKPEKIHIGYVSDSFHWHTVGMVFLGWIQYCQKQDFEIYCYYINNQIDQITEEYQKYSNYFHHIPHNLEATCQQITDDKLHILVFLDVGMTPQMTQLAALRLAPIQCAAWGHPVTTGLPTIDYYLSADSLEPENAQEHYSEQLIRLPNIGISYSKPLIPAITKTRADFELRENAVIYLSCQSLFKYLPQYDYIFPTIAQNVGRSQFVFIAHPINEITEQFRQRIQQEFTKFDLNFEDYCIILPRQNQQDYRQINLLADISLDTIGFTGFLTTIESIACNLPIVTCVGEFMRSRQTYGIFKMLGITETIAKNPTEYIQIAVKLGCQPEWRQKIVEQIKHSQTSLYNDRTSITALEEFYRRVILK
ncbi:tetratricopeptide repeat protein [Phormidium sp. LEGE 05292]|uniref:tetratricopeptide repeat protein n=1 Tax=[Phormidium] sp. LEGE 05292 TaxID=767427 RepID=UPI00188244DD|nr:tetratricopeptide repeat protein [Phormidium sp. LEGE 05292]MBE9225180.1 tetratricopeptide repeat protein [Phormidium sp. LEGE 05292]